MEPVNIPICQMQISCENPSDGDADSSRDQNYQLLWLL